MASTSKKKVAEKPGRAPQDRRVTTPSAWKRSSRKPEEVTLPSGNVCLARRPGPAEILQNGIMPDSLMPIITDAIRSGKGLPKEVEKELAQTPEQLFELLDGVDRAVVSIVVEPTVMYHKAANEDGVMVVIPDEDRNTDEFIYTDEVDLDDKMFLFNFAVGGTRDLDRFREQTAERVGDVADVAGDGGAAE